MAKDRKNAKTAPARPAVWLRGGLALLLAAALGLVAVDAAGLRQGGQGPEPGGDRGVRANPGDVAREAAPAATRAPWPAPPEHDLLTLDESGLADGGALTFLDLEKWDYAPDDPKSAPESVSRLDGEEVTLSGFMFPLDEGRNIVNFCLLKTTQTCCYGPAPQLNQYVLVEMRTPVRMVAARPVTVTGRFFVEPRPEDGYIYRMDGKRFSDAADARLRVAPR